MVLVWPMPSVTPCYNHRPSEPMGRDECYNDVEAESLLLDWSLPREDDSLSDSESYLKSTVNMVDLWSTFTGDRYIHKVNEQKPGCRNSRPRVFIEKTDQHSDFRVVANKMCRLDD